MAYNIKKEKERFSTFQQESWFVPLISKDMLSHMNDEREMYRRALVKLNALNAKASYLYIFEEPVAHYRNEEWKCPEKMYLVARQIGGEVIAYKEGERSEVFSGFPLMERLDVTRRMTVIMLQPFFAFFQENAIWDSGDRN